jgi:hypothetical protein
MDNGRKIAPFQERPYWNVPPQFSWVKIKELRFGTIQVSVSSVYGTIAILLDGSCTMIPGWDKSE